MVAGRKKRFKKKCKLEVGWEEGMLKKDCKMKSMMGGRKIRKIRKQGLKKKCKRKIRKIRKKGLKKEWKMGSRIGGRNVKEGL